MFQADAPNQKWVADFTCIWTAEGWVYAAAVLDLYSRRIVGWSMQDSMTSQLVADALMMPPSNCTQLQPSAMFKSSWPIGRDKEFHWPEPCRRNRWC